MSRRSPVDEDGHRLVIRDGRAKGAACDCRLGHVGDPGAECQRQRIDEESDERRRFSSTILPRYARRSPRATELLSVVSLDRLSSGDFGPAQREP